MAFPATGFNWSTSLESAFLAALDDDYQKIEFFLTQFKKFLNDTKENDGIAYTSKILAYLSNHITNNTQLPTKFLHNLFEEIGTEEIKKLLFLKGKNDFPLLLTLLNDEKILFSNMILRTLSINSAKDVTNLKIQKYSDPATRKQLSLKLNVVTSQYQTYDALIAILVKFGAETVPNLSSTSSNQNDRNSLTRAPIHVAIAQGDFTNFQVLLEINSRKEAIEQKTASNEHTPLHYTIVQAQPMMAKELLLRHANRFAKNIFGQNAFHLSIVCDQAEIFATLLEGLNKKDLESAFSSTDNAGFTLLHYIASSNNSKFVEYIKPKILFLQMGLKERECQRLFDRTINKTVSIKLNNRTLDFTAYHLSFLFGNKSLFYLLQGYLYTNKNTISLLGIFLDNFVVKSNFQPLREKNPDNVVIFDPYKGSLSSNKHSEQIKILHSEFNPDYWKTELEFTDTVFDPDLEQKLASQQKPLQLNEQQKTIRTAIQYARKQIQSKLIVHKKAQPETVIKRGNPNPSATIYANDPRYLAPNPSEPQNANDPPLLSLNDLPLPSPEVIADFENWQKQFEPQPPIEPNSHDPNIQRSNDNSEQIENENSDGIIVPSKPIPAPALPTTYALPLGNPSLPKKVVLEKFKQEPLEKQEQIVQTVNYQNQQVIDTLVNKEESNKELLEAAQERDNNDNNSILDAPKKSLDNENENNIPPPPALEPQTLQTEKEIDTTRNLSNNDVNSSKDKKPANSPTDTAALLASIRKGIQLKPTSLSERPIGKSKSPIGKEVEKSVTIADLLFRSMHERRDAYEGKTKEDKQQGVDPSEWGEPIPTSANRYSMPFTQSLVELLKDAEQIVDTRDTVTIISTSQYLKEQIQAKLTKIHDENTESRHSIPKIYENDPNDNTHQSEGNKSFSIILSPTLYNKLLEDDNAFDRLKVISTIVTFCD